MCWLLVARIWLWFNVLDIVTETFKDVRRIPSIHPSTGSPTRNVLQIKVYELYYKLCCNINTRIFLSACGLCLPLNWHSRTVQHKVLEFHISFPIPLTGLHLPEAKKNKVLPFSQALNRITLVVTPDSY